MKKWIFKLQNRFIRSSGEDINYVTMQKMLKENNDIIVIDVRTKDEYECNHLHGAINIPLQDISESKVKRYIRNKNDIIIVYCEYGGRSKKAMNKLKKMGYENVYNLYKGIEAI